MKRITKQSAQNDDDGGGGDVRERAWLLGIRTSRSRRFLVVEQLTIDDDYDNDDDDGGFWPTRVEIS